MSTVAVILKLEVSLSQNDFSSMLRWCVVDKLVFTPQNDWSNKYYAAEREKMPLPFAAAGMGLESIMRSEMSRAVRDKYHVVSTVSGA